MCGNRMDVIQTIQIYSDVLPSDSHVFNSAILLFTKCFGYSQRRRSNHFLSLTSHTRNKAAVVLCTMCILLARAYQPQCVLYAHTHPLSHAFIQKPCVKLESKQCNFPWYCPMINCMNFDWRFQTTTVNCI